MNETSSTRAEDASVLILTPVKDAAVHLPGYVDRIEALQHPRHLLSIGLIEGDSADATWPTLNGLRARLEARCARATVIKRDFGFRLPPSVPRWTPAYQVARRTTLARARNNLLFAALRDEDWVLWIDVDVEQFPADLVSRLLEVGRDIVHPHCVTDWKGPTFDRNGWTHHGKRHLDSYRGHPLVRLDSVGGTVLLIKADHHRDGLVFPAFRYGSRMRRHARRTRYGAKVRSKPKASRSWRRTWDFNVGACLTWKSGMPAIETLHRQCTTDSAVVPTIMAPA